MKKFVFHSAILALPGLILSPPSVAQRRPRRLIVCISARRSITRSGSAIGPALPPAAGRSSGERGPVRSTIFRARSGLTQTSSPHPTPLHFRI